MDKKLKPIPAGNKGLPNLPKPVRNKMGFLKEGGMADKRSPFMGGGIAYAGGGRAMKREMYSQGTKTINKVKPTLGLKKTKEYKKKQFIKKLRKK